MFVKSPDDILNFVWDWATEGWLDPGDSIASVSFTAAGGVTIQQLHAPDNLAVTGGTTGGTLAATTYYYVMTSLDPGNGETTKSSEVSVTLTTSTSTATLTFLPVPNAAQYVIYRGTSTGSENVKVAVISANNGVTNSYTDTGTVASPPILTSITDPDGPTTFPIPAWANEFDIIAVAGGMGCYGIGPAPSYPSAGGFAGTWNGVTLTRPGSIPATTTTMYVDVGQGGIGANEINGIPQDHPQAGYPSTIIIPGYGTITAAGVGQTPGYPGTLDGTGQSPGNYTFNGNTYTGGSSAAINTAANAPGGGAPAETGSVTPPTGRGLSGAPGAIWILASQTGTQSSATPPGSNNSSEFAFTNTTATIWIGSGTAGDTYALTCQITTAAGLTAQWTQNLNIIDL